MRPENSLSIRAGGRRGYVGAAIAINLVVWVAVAFSFRQSGWGAMDAPTVVLVLASALVLLRCARPGIELTPAGIDVSGLIRVRRIPWDEIRGIQVGRILGARQVSVSLENGEVVKLPAPGDWWPVTDGEFDGKFEQLESWWSRYRTA